MKEIWKIVDGCSNYKISNTGNVSSNYIRGGSGRTSDTFKLISKRILFSGYEVFNIRLSGKLKTLYIHREMAKVFLPKIKAKNQVNHKNGIKHDNRIENLEWCDPSENQLHAVKNNLTTKKFGLNHWNNKLDECQLLTIITMLPHYRNFEIIKHFPISDACIRRIRRCETYKNFPRL
jgi:hypothetical protein